MSRLLTQMEIDDFSSRLPLDIWGMVFPSDCRFVQDYAYGVVLIFRKTDGTVLHIQTDLTAPPDENDPNLVSYVAAETVKSIGQNIVGVGFELKNFGIIAVIVVVGALVWTMIRK